ncbi:MAG TPA: ABC transporter substrate-binding protein [Anaerolineales bacterium]|nr:ABC transporter substrate-binding protein [Anaerolineae bacterium]HRK87879.1 ABC transporter substrate-binding protein [Anaerolineales bacterium]
MLRKTLILTLLIALLAACAPQTTPVVDSAPTEISVAEAVAPEANLTDTCVAEGEFDASIDYFPEKTALTHTDSFSVEYFNNYKVVTVKTPYPGATESMQYALVQCGTPTPEGFLDEQIIEVPVQTVVTMSTTYLPFLDELGLLDRLVGLDDATYVNNATVLKMAEEGKLTMLGYGSGVNVEQALDLSPDLIITYGSGAPDYDAHPVLIEAGLKTIVNAEWLETSPLGRAEWGKFIAVFFNKEADAEALFAKTVQQYEEYAALAASVTEKPTVFTGSDYQGTWSMPGGNSFAANFLKDAGADYLWAGDTSTGSLPLAFEAVFEKAQDADYWVNIGYFFTPDDLLAADARYADFAAYQNGNIWNNDAIISANGGNDYYESAVAHPELVLADLIKIFHPELLPDYELVYYRQLK